MPQFILLALVSDARRRPVFIPALTYFSASPTNRFNARRVLALGIRMCHVSYLWGAQLNNAFASGKPQREEGYSDDAATRALYGGAAAHPR